MGCLAIRTYYVVISIVLLSFVSESFCLKCHHCGWSEEGKSYRKKVIKEEELTYPIAEIDISGDVRSPPTKDEVQRYCKEETCAKGALSKSSCMTWSFITNHPINITYMCISNPGGRSGCFRQQIPNEEFLEVEVCLCREDKCNRAVNARNFITLPLVLTVLLLLVSS